MNFGLFICVREFVIFFFSLLSSLNIQCEVTNSELVHADIKKFLIEANVKREENKPHVQINPMNDIFFFFFFLNYTQMSR